MCFCGPSVFCRTGRSNDFATPGWTVLGNQLPIAGVDIQVYEGIFEAVFETFLLPAVPSRAFALTEFTYSSCFGMVVRHSGDLACPSSLGFLSEGVNTGDAGPF